MLLLALKVDCIPKAAPEIFAPLPALENINLNNY